jgi:hypothetical protein
MSESMPETYSADGKTPVQLLTFLLALQQAERLLDEDQVLVGVQIEANTVDSVVVDIAWYPQGETFDRERLRIDRKIIYWGDTTAPDDLSALLG